MKQCRIHNMEKGQVKEHANGIKEKDQQDYLTCYEKIGNWTDTEQKEKMLIKLAYPFHKVEFTLVPYFVAIFCLGKINANYVLQFHQKKNCFPFQRNNGYAKLKE